MQPGRTLSTTSISLENLLSIRPSGVVSKTSIPHRSTFVRSNLCISTAANKHPNAKARDPTSVVRAKIFEMLIFGHINKQNK